VSGAGPITVNVTNKSLNAQTWTWHWDDGSPDEFTSTPIAHTYSTPNVYTVTLTVKNTVGTSTRSRAVTVTTGTGTVTADFYGTPVSIPPAFIGGGGSSGAAITGSRPLVVQFTNVSSNGTAYSWDFGDGTSPSAVAGPSHTYSNLGVFSVTLTVTGPSGVTPITRALYITTGCVVPNFANTSTSNADATYSGAGGAGFLANSITYHAVGAPGNGSKNAPNGKNIVSQSPLAGGVFVATTKKGSTWVCSGDITLEYTP
jgi:FOG: PKD repeat